MSAERNGHVNRLPPSNFAREALTKGDLVEASKAIYDRTKELVGGEIRDAEQKMMARFGAEFVKHADDTFDHLMKKYLTTVHGDFEDKAKALADAYALKALDMARNYDQKLLDVERRYEQKALELQNDYQQKITWLSQVNEQALAGLRQFLEQFQALAPHVTVQVPEQPTPQVHFTAPEQAPPQVNVNVPPMPTPHVNVNVPEQPTPHVNVNVPASPEPRVNVNVPPPRRIRKFIEYDVHGRPVCVEERELMDGETSEI